MNEQTLCLAIATIALFPMINAQWKGGLPVAPAETIRVSVAGASAAAAPPPAAVAPPPAAPVPAAVPAPAAVPVPIARPAPAPIPARMPAAVPPPAPLALPAHIPVQGLPPSVPASMGGAGPNGFINQMFGNGFYDEVWSDRPCGMSRRPNRWTQEALGTMTFTCGCRMFIDTFDLENVDNTPQARRDCMTHITRTVCCLV